MNLFRPLLAQNILPTDVIPGASHWMGLTLKELLILLGAVAIVTLFLVVWAVYFRKTPHQHSHRGYKYPEGDQQNKSSSDTESEDLDEKRYRRKRRRRREHRPRNPTLA